jgi:hypothetical protein
MVTLWPGRSGLVRIMVAAQPVHVDTAQAALAGDVERHAGRAQVHLTGSAGLCLPADTQVGQRAGNGAVVGRDCFHHRRAAVDDDVEGRRRIKRKRLADGGGKGDGAALGVEDAVAADYTEIRWTSSHRPETERR